MDERDAEFQTQWEADPVPPRLVSLRSLVSNMHSSPAIDFENNTVPTLVINQGLDKMVDIGVTRINYERLGGKMDGLIGPNPLSEKLSENGQRIEVFPCFYRQIHANIHSATL